MNENEMLKEIELGELPEDWEVSTIQSVSALPMQNGLFYEPSRKGSGVLLINVGDMYKISPIGLHDLDLFNATPAEIKTFKVLFGDLFFTRSSIVPSGIAHCNFYACEDTGIDTVFDSHIIRVRPNLVVVDPSYFYLACGSDLARKHLVSSAKTATMTTIDQKAIESCPILLPPKKEQTAIANALSDVDNLITSLEKLIAKKRAFKTATMQQLLTGKTRLPGFSNEWVEMILGEFGACYRGVSYKPDSDLFECDTDDSFRLLRSNNVQHQRVLFSNMQYVVDDKVSQTQILRNDDVLICMANGSKDLVGKAGRFKQIDGYRYTFGAFMGCYRPDLKKCDPGFVFNLFQTNEFRLHIGIILAGSSINNLRPSNIEGFSTQVPEDKREQAAISNVLSDMDKEIDNLEVRLNKTQQLKQGMMQELLTGKTRLV